MTRVPIRSVTAALERAGIVAVVRIDDRERVKPALDAILAGGVRAVEITMTVSGAVDLIRALAPVLPADVILGAGTVVDGRTATAVIDAGARFVVSPVYRREVVETCLARDIPVIPGCFTPTEILDAWDRGADIVKVFPATSLGPSYLKDIHGPLPHIKLMPTGGVSLDNAGDWIRAGAVAVGVGTALLDRRAVADGDWAKLRANAKRIVASVAAARGGTL
jgi:2-dehydro-3-deoxyphosphogluconate aldolase/(4S)-4-hydroxy-2-oxoglutarate aldolase